jgi:ribosomal protein L18E
MAPPGKGSNAPRRRKASLTQKARQLEKQKVQSASQRLDRPEPQTAVVAISQMEVFLDHAAKGGKVVLVDADSRPIAVIDCSEESYRRQIDALNGKLLQEPQE